MMTLFRDIATISQTDAAVLIEGDTGVGKTLVAEAIHEQSPRAGKPFIAFSAANLAEQLFESELFGHVKGAFSGAHNHHLGLARAADGGTLFLDEAAELSWINQGKLLHFLDQKVVRPVGAVRGYRTNVRLICATNQDLHARVQEGAFRRDLYYRLRVFGLRVPPLSARCDDIPLLVEYFIERFCAKYGKRLAGVDPEVKRRLLRHPWEGNVRELENEMERLVVMTPEGERIGSHRLSNHILAASHRKNGNGRSLLEQAVHRAECEVLIKALERQRWNVAATAREMGISRVGLSRKLKRLGIERPGTRSARS